MAGRRTSKTKPSASAPAYNTPSSLMVPPSVGDIVYLWAGARRATKTKGVPNYLDGRDATVIEVCDDGTFVMDVESALSTSRLLPGEARRRVVRLDEMSQNLGNPKDWPRDEE